MRLAQIQKKFKRGNCCVFGLRGCGKDVLMGNIIARQKKQYISNLNYTKDDRFIPFNPNDFDCGQNTYKEFISGSLKSFDYKHPHGVDLFISDVGIYFPSQFCNELNRDYKYFPVYFALSRQISENNVHINVQALNRCWDKIREQSDTYILCNWCKVLFGKIVLMKVTLYEKYESAVARVPSFRLHMPLLANKEMRMRYDIQKENYRISYGEIKSGFLCFINKSSHDTLALGKALKGEKNEENTEKN